MRVLPPQSAWQLPVQWPDAARPARGLSERQTDGLLKAAIVFALLAVTVLDRFGLRVTADFSLPPAMVALYALAALMYLLGVGDLNGRGALSYVLLMSVAGLSYLVNASFEPRQYLTLTSYALLVVAYAPFALSLRAVPFAPELWRWTLRMYVRFSLLLALAGIAQFFAQFFFRPEWLFDYTALIPEALRASGGWNTENQAGAWIKSNGFFLREASMFSIAMALGLLCELHSARRVWAMATLGLALLVTYSGSGLFCLGAGLLFPVGRRSLARVGVLVGLATVTFVFLGEALNLSYTVERVGEVSQRTSAYCRFVYPGAMVLQQIDANVWTSLLGHGPGTMARMGGTCTDLHQPTYAKIAFEYGLAGALALAVLILGALRRAGLHSGIAVALGLGWLVFGGNLLAADVLLVIYLLSAMWPAGANAAR